MPLPAPATSHFLLLAGLGLASCHRAAEVAAPAATITSFSPGSGGRAAVVTITGEGFSTTPASNSVTINGVAATVQSASATELVVVVPPKAGSGPITVAVTGREMATTKQVFHYLYKATVSTFVASTPFIFVPHSLAFDGQGNLYVTNRYTNTIERFTSTGEHSVLAGSSQQGHLDGPAATAQFSQLAGLTVDAQGNVYVTEDDLRSTIRKITPSGQVSTVAGLVGSGFTNGSLPRFNQPIGLAIDSKNVLYVSDAGNFCVRQLWPSGVASTFAGGSIIGCVQGGFADGPAQNALFVAPFGLQTDAKGNVYVADSGNNRVRKISPDGQVSTLSGNGNCGSTDGLGAEATFSVPTGVALDGRGSVVVSELEGGRIRLVAPDGFTTTLAGLSRPCPSPFAGWNRKDGPGAEARFSAPYSLALSPSGDIYVADTGNNAIRKLVLE